MVAVDSGDDRRARAHWGHSGQAGRLGPPCAPRSPTGLPTVPYTASIFALAFADRFVVAAIDGSAAVGQYQVAFAFGFLGVVLVQSLQLAWVPMTFGASEVRAVGDARRSLGHGRPAGGLHAPGSSRWRPSRRSRCWFPATTTRTCWRRLRRSRRSRPWAGALFMARTQVLLWKRRTRPLGVDHAGSGGPEPRARGRTAAAARAPGRGGRHGGRRGRPDGADRARRGDASPVVPWRVRSERLSYGFAAACAGIALVATRHGLGHGLAGRAHAGGRSRVPEDARGGTASHPAAGPGARSAGPPRASVRGSLEAWDWDRPGRGAGPAVVEGRPAEHLLELRRVGLVVGDEPRASLGAQRVARGHRSRAVVASLRGDRPQGPVPVKPAERVPDRSRKRPGCLANCSNRRPALVEEADEPVSRGQLRAHHVAGVEVGRHVIRDPDERPHRGQHGLRIRCELGGGHSQYLRGLEHVEVAPEDSPVLAEGHVPVQPVRVLACLGQRLGSEKLVERGLGIAAFRPHVSRHRVMRESSLDRVAEDRDQPDVRKLAGDALGDLPLGVAPGNALHRGRPTCRPESPCRSPRPVAPRAGCGARTGSIRARNPRH